MNWTKRNWYAIVFWGIFVLVGVCIYRTDGLPWSAHAQAKPQTFIIPLKNGEPECWGFSNGKQQRMECPPEGLDTGSPTETYSIGSWIEQHCVAVIVEKETIHHKLSPQPPHFDDRMEWDEQINECTARLRCTPDGKK